MCIQPLTRAYLSRTTAHGFSRLVDGPSEGNGGPFRKLWALAIFVSFCTSAYLVWSSVQEAKANPVATNVNAIRVQVILDHNLVVMYRANVLYRTCAAITVYVEFRLF